MLVLYLGDICFVAILDWSTILGLSWWVNGHVYSKMDHTEVLIHFFTRAHFLPTNLIHRAHFFGLYWYIFLPLPFVLKCTGLLFYSHQKNWTILIHFPTNAIFLLTVLVHFFSGKIFWTVLVHFSLPPPIFLIKTGTLYQLFPLFRTVLVHLTSLSQFLEFFWYTFPTSLNFWTVLGC